ncbi:MAG: DUF192 domain-containing protein [Treponema sp.]|jgi:uncharacterized membrane protein (UPF0127 family)|nr:DUF192 domain-containing protein [Treponema sp.]
MIFNRRFSPSLCITIFCLLFTLTACERKLPVKEILIERDGQGIAAVNAEIAGTQEERNKGLMFRKKLPDGEGMLFVYETDQVMSFWMKNTYIPLSIAFITHDGRIIDIKDMYPHDLSSVVSSRSARYALEAPQGWFSRAGVRTGDIVKIPKE